MKKRHQSGILAVLSAAVAIMTSNAPARADEFSDARLRSGEDAYIAKRYLDAIAELKIAAFGSLDRPPALSEALVWLALAQNGAGRAPDLQATVDRFLEVERRFGAYPKARLEPDTRAAFQAVLLKRVPQETILAIPSLAGLVETDQQRNAKMAPADRRRTLEAAAKREPTQVKWPQALAHDALDRGDTKEAIRWADRALELQPGDADALAVRGRAHVLRGEYAAAAKDLAALPPEAFAKQPDLSADRFVALVETGDWSGAEQALTSLTVNSGSRPDVARAQQKLAAEKQRRSAASATAAASAPAPPSRPRPADGSPSAAPASPGASSAPTSAGGPAPVPGKPVASPAETSATRSRDALAESRRLIATGKSAEAVRLLNDALRADPANRELRLALLEAGCLSRSYSVAAAQLPLVTPFSDQEAAPMFYAAVVLYETGRDNEAKSYLERAVPRVSGPLVDEYSRKILGRP